MIAVIGAGRMGLPICVRLLRAGYAVTAGDASARPAATVRRYGGTWRSRPAEAVEYADTVLTVLPGPEECRRVMLDDGVIDEMRPGATWIDLTSNTPATAASIRARAQDRGLRVLEAPMGGGPDEARDGTLRLYVGGPSDVLRRHRAMLDVIATPERIVHTGGPNSGYVTKLLVNSLWFTQATAVAEVLLLGARLGLDPSRLRGTLRAGPADCAFLTAPTDALMAGDRMATFELDRICDELAAVTTLAREHGVPGEVAALVSDIHRRALSAYGPAAGELLVAAYLEDRMAPARPPRRPRL